MFDAELAPNPEPRLPCLMLLDTSTAMQGLAIEALNAALPVFAKELSTHPLGYLTVEIAILGFGEGVNIIQDFVPLASFAPPRLWASGSTPLEQAIPIALEHLNQRKQAYRQSGVDYYRPWLFIISGQSPASTSSTSSAATQVQLEVEQKKLTVLTAAISPLQPTTLEAFSPSHPPVGLKAEQLSKLMLWFAQNISRPSKPTPNPTTT